MGKTAYIIVGIILVISLLLVVGYFKITKSNTVKAFLNVEQGSVQVDTGNGWIDASDEMELGSNDKIKTLANGYASLVLFESAVISLEPDTEIAISDLSKKLSKIRQNAGSTWNKFTGLAGLEGLSVETPTTVATVRGTSFGVDMDSVIVGDGIVEVEMNKEKIILNADEKMIIQQGRMIKKALENADREKIARKMPRIVETMKKIRMKEVRKKEFIARQLQKKYGLADETVKEYLDRADKGEFDLNEIERKSPVKIETVKKLREITEKIIEENKAIERLAQKRKAIQQSSEKSAIEPVKERPSGIR